jgi:hypothetical protein
VGFVNSLSCMVIYEPGLFHMAKMIRTFFIAAVLACLGWFAHDYLVDSRVKLSGGKFSGGRVPVPEQADLELLYFKKVKPWHEFAMQVNAVLDKEHAGAYKLPLSMMELRKSALAYNVGKDLAASRCGVCHLPPAPDDLPRDSWNEFFQIKHMMLSAAGLLMSSMPADGYRVYKTLTQGRMALWDAPIPEYALPMTEFAALVYYHTFEAPADTYSGLPSSAGTAPFKLTHLKEADWQGEGFLLSQILEDGLILVGRARDPALFVINAQGEMQTMLKVPGVPTGFTRGPDGFHYVTLIAKEMETLLHPNQGSILRVRYRNKALLDPRIVVENLERPIRVHFADVDANGHDEMLVLEFGWLTGGLTEYKQVGTGQWAFARRIIDAPGVIGVESLDVNGNGQTDIIVLIAQAEQTLNLLRNHGGGEFKREVLTQRPPGFGFNSLMLADVTGDGQLDIITTNGDNFDLLTQPLKPQHGVRIFINDGAGGFPEEFFYPMFGAIQTVAANFENDGVFGIAAVALGPRSTTPVSFVYLKPDKDIGFRPQHIAELAGTSWVSLAAGKLKNRHSPSIVMTSFAGMADGNGWWLMLLEPPAPVE